MNIYGVSIGDGFVVFADHSQSKSVVDYFADKPEYETSKYLTVIKQKFDKAVEALGAGVLFGYRCDQDDTVFIIASTEKRDGYKYPEYGDDSFHTAYLLAKVERGCISYGVSRAMGSVSRAEGVSVSFGESCSFSESEGSVSASRPEGNIGTH